MARLTKERILLAAMEEFAAKGFYGATVRGICSRAHANIAAVNYYFSGKEALYRQVLDHLFRYVESRRPLLDGPEAEASFREKAERWALAKLKNLSDSSPEHRCLSRIMFWEMLSPSEIFPDIFRQYIEPVCLEPLAEGLRAELPPWTGRSEVYGLIFGLLSQCLFFEQNKVLVSQALGPGFMEEPGRREAIARQIATGAAAAVAEARRAPAADAA